jgi:hypothetical protein
MTEEEEDTSPAPQPPAAIQQLAQLYLVFDDDSSSEDYEANPPIPSGHLDICLTLKQAARMSTANYLSRKLTRQPKARK